MKQEILSQLYDDAVLHDRAYKELIDNVEYDKARELLDAYEMQQHNLHADFLRTSHNHFQSF